MLQWRRKFTPIQIHAKLAAQRTRRSAVETRGAKTKWTRAHVMAANRVRRQKIKACRGAKYVKWDAIIRSSRTPRVHRTTAAKAFKREGIPAQFRPLREKPQRTEEHDEERVRICGRMRNWPEEKFTDELDMIIDCKQWEAALTPEGRHHQAKQQVHGQIRTPAEGLEKDFTKPNKKKHRKSVGGYVRVLAGVSNGRIVLWEHYKRWNGKTAAEMYEGPIIRTLRKKRGVKPSYLIAEDNDPTGFKSGAGVDAKKAKKIRTIPWPRYSPDLMPLDFSLWEAIKEKMKINAPRGRETLADFKVRLRRTALATSPAVVRKAVVNMKFRAQKIWDADGGDIARD